MPSQHHQIVKSIIILTVFCFCVFGLFVRHLLLLHKHCTVSEPDSPLAVLANSHQELYRIIAYLADITLKDLAKRGKNTE